MLINYHDAKICQNGGANLGLVLASDARECAVKAFSAVKVKGISRVHPGSNRSSLLKYAWQKDYCFPGQETLAKEMGAGRRSVVRFMAELEKHGFVTIKRRGQGKSNVYVVHFQTKKPVDKERAKIS